jgi:murein L,D-transpeptidase YcbB/YkuD
MGFFRKLAFIAVLLSPLLFIQTSHSENGIEFMVVPVIRDLPSYNTVIDVFSLDEIRLTISRIREHGLNPRSYWDEDMERLYQKGDTERQQLKPRANQVFQRLLMDVSLGTVDPELLSPDIKLKRKKFLTPEQLQTMIIITGQNAALLVDKLAPQNPPYISLKNSLAKIYPACQNGQWVSLVPAGESLRLGVKNPSVIGLKRYFSFLGYEISSFDEVVDYETVYAINDIEWNMHVKPDGVLSPSGKVWQFLNTPCMVRVHQLQADMEKMRWFPNQFEDRYIFVNLAMAYLVMADKTQSPPYVTSFRTINGRTERKSPTMKDRIVQVILNPYWVVPPTIFIEDKVQEIRNLPSWQINDYFDSHNYEVWNKSFTRKIDPASIDWWSINSALDSEIYIRQRPNYWNALGVIKFELTNSFSVYLHDTNQRELFFEPQRLLSSGCIRVEKPLDLAEYLLKDTLWDRAKIESVLAKPGQIMKTDTWVEVKNPMAVYTVFLTSFLSSDGIIRFTKDTYEQNNRILKNLMEL